MLRLTIISKVHLNPPANSVTSDWFVTIWRISGSFFLVLCKNKKRSGPQDKGYMTVSPQRLGYGQRLSTSSVRALYLADVFFYVFLVGSHGCPSGRLGEGVTFQYFHICFSVNRTRSFGHFESFTLYFVIFISY